MSIITIDKDAKISAATNRTEMAGDLGANEAIAFDAFVSNASVTQLIFLDPQASIFCLATGEI